MKLFIYCLIYWFVGLLLTYVHSSFEFFIQFFLGSSLFFIPCLLFLYVIDKADRKIFNQILY